MSDDAIRSLLTAIVAEENSFNDCHGGELCELDHLTLLNGYRRAAAIFDRFDTASRSEQLWAEATLYSARSAYGLFEE